MMCACNQRMMITEIGSNPPGESSIKQATQSHIAGKHGRQESGELEHNKNSASTVVTLASVSIRMSDMRQMRTAKKDCVMREPSSRPTLPCNMQF